MSSTFLPRSRFKRPTDSIDMLSQSAGNAIAWLGLTPNWLRAAVVAAALLSALLAWAICSAAQQQRQTITTIAKDSAPSIVAGQMMRASLADMHGNLANELLVVPNQGTQAVGDFNKRLAESAESLLTAARNITYDGEVEPVRTVLNELPRYEELAGRARVLHDQRDPRFLAQHQAADEIMRTRLLPAVDELVKVNQRELDKAYAAERMTATANWLLVLAAGAALTAALAGLKIVLCQRMRRVINPPLLAAVLLAAGVCLWALVALWRCGGEVKLAKQDAFDSIAVLQAARATAYDANGDESRWLLCKFHGGAAELIRLYADDFEKKALRIAAFPGGRLSTANLQSESDVEHPAPAGMQGYLADELNNITFPHELEAAWSALTAFQAYLRIDERLRRVQDEKTAVELCVGTRAGESNWAFDQFEDAVTRTIAVNQSYFQASLQNAAAGLAGLDGWLPLGSALAISALAFLGVRPRLNEYAGH